MSKIIQLPIVVTHNVKVVEHNNTSYVRTRDIADALGVKQPFEFTSDIRKSRCIKWRRYKGLPRWNRQYSHTIHESVGYD